MRRISPGFPLSLYRTDFALQPCTPVAWHWHEDFQICLVERGAVRFHVVDQSYVLPAGTGLFLNCRLAHRAEPETPGASYLGVNVHPDLICTEEREAVYREMVRPVLRRSEASLFVFDPNTPDGAALSGAVRRMLRYAEQGGLNGRELLIQSELLRVWPTVLKIVTDSGERISAAGNRRLKEIVRYLGAHYAEKVTLRSVADRVHISPGECSRFFKRVTGVTLFQYLMQYRVERSKELLCGTDRSIAEIAQETGFSTQSYYAVCFQRLEHCTPNQYRRMSQLADLGR